VGLALGCHDDSSHIAEGDVLLAIRRSAVREEVQVIQIQLLGIKFRPISARLEVSRTQSRRTS
jgi:hypothetical protein